MKQIASEVPKAETRNKKGKNYDDIVFTNVCVSHTEVRFRGRVMAVNVVTGYGKVGRVLSFTLRLP